MTDRKDALITLLDHVVGAGDAPSQAEWRNAFDSVIEGRPSKNHYPILRDQARLAFMGSIDSAKALHNAVLPGWEYGITYNSEQLDGPCAFVAPWGATEDAEGYEACAINPARAWLIAILKALIAKYTTQDGEP
jgi:hypothetical protein